LLALFGHGAMSELSPLSGAKRKSHFGAVRSGNPKRPFRLCGFRTSISLRSYGRRCRPNSESGVRDCSLHGLK
jgi:hypothetical protein